MVVTQVGYRPYGTKKRAQKSHFFLCKQSKKRRKEKRVGFILFKWREANQNGTDVLRLSELSSVPLLTRM